MKFVCGNCSTQYLISDDKVGPKGIRVRCKRCGNVIVVRPDAFGREKTEPSDPVSPGSEDVSTFSRGSAEGEQDDVGQAFDQLLQGARLGQADGGLADEGGQATEDFSGGDSSHLLQPSGGTQDRIDQVFAGAESTELVRSAVEPDSIADWYVAIGDQQNGPMSLAELEARWTAGEVGPQSLAWYPGLSDWAPVEDLLPLRHLLSMPWAGKGGTTTAGVPPEAAESSAQDASQSADEVQWAPYKGSTLAPLVKEEMSMSTSDPPLEEDEQAVAKGVGDPDEGLVHEDGELNPWDREDASSDEVARPVESFFDSSLDKKLDDVGEGYFGTTPRRSGRVLAGPAYLGAKKRRSKIRLVLVAGLVAVGASATIVLLTGEPRQSPQVLAPVEPPIISQPAKAARSSSDKGNVEGDRAPAESGEPSAEEIVVKKPVVDRRTAKTDQAAGNIVTTSRSTRQRRQKPSKNRVLGATTGRSTTPSTTAPKLRAKPAGDGDGGLPQKLTKAQINKTMKKHLEAMRGCVKQQLQRDPSVTGTMVLSFVIEPSGRVSAVTIKTNEHKGTYVAGCISYIIKSMKFPRAREAYTIPRLPLNLGG